MTFHQYRYYEWVMGVVALFFFVSPVWAQETAAPVVLQALTAPLAQVGIAPAQPAPTSPPPPPVVVNTAPDGVVSVLFTAVETEAIAQARKQYSSRGTAEESEADLLDQLQGIKATKKPDAELQDKYYAQFYLESLIYHTPSDWMSWLKGSEVGKKFTPISLAANDVGIKVLRVGKEDMTYEWKPKDWQQVVKAFKGNNPAIVLDSAQRVVVFTLRVNQTISSYDMQIREGPVSPTIFVAGGGADNAEKPLPAAADAGTAGVVPSP